MTNTNLSIEYVNEMNDKINNLDQENNLILPPIDKSKRNNSQFISKTI
jgi:hypothetical protein